jgi:hypothetical protein
MPGACEHPGGEKWKNLYEELLSKGHTEESAAKIANAQFSDERNDSKHRIDLSNRWRLTINRQ